MLETIHPIPAFIDNYIWTVTDASRQRAAVVDPGDASPVLDYLAANGLQLEAVLITHHHPDHVGGLRTLIDEFAPVVYGPRNPSIAGIDRSLAEGDSLELFGARFTVLEVPGHTLDHIAYFSDSEEPPVLFCGDTLFAAGCGRLFEGTPAMMVESLGKLTALPRQTRVYCTHEYTLANLRFARAVEPDNTELAQRAQREQARRDADKPTLPSSLALELQTNPFLRCRQPQLRAAAESRTGAGVEDEVAVFAAIRRWKDSF